MSVTHSCLQEWDGLICHAGTPVRPQPSQGAGTFHCLEKFVLLQQYQMSQNGNLGNTVFAMFLCCVYL